MALIQSYHTTESVSSGHPDKICDQIADAIVDASLEIDPESRVAVDVFGSFKHFKVAGEITSKAVINYNKIVLDTYHELGYTGYCEVDAHIRKQSPDISLGVNKGGAGDQGIMYGYATSSTKNFMPKSFNLANQILKDIETFRSNTGIKIGPDAKSQVTAKHYKYTTVILSVLNPDDIPIDELKALLIKKILEPNGIDVTKVNFLLNPTGKFSKGGFSADSGLTGRKIMIDTYGGLVPHGGGAFSGKDPTKVDRSGAYMCRYVAKNLVANKVARECIVSVSYSIGKENPTMVYAINENHEKIPTKILKKFDFRPRAIIEQLNLQNIKYQPLATYGHFGRTEYPWEDIIELK